ncbi:MAG: leucine-rich repeat domain-containing protein [Trueperaceae bacterium]|nr:leucine-rich repeat domain-containing protein [Trueperaceae bacterium]
MVYLQRFVAVGLNIALVVTLTSVLTSVAWGQSTPAERTRVAVLPFNVYGLVRDLPDEFGRALAIAVEGQLVRQPGFQVVTRNDLDPLLDELALGEQGVLEPSQAQRLGQLAGAELIITGDLVVESAQTWVLSARFVAVKTGEVQTAVSLELPADTSLTTLANSLVITALPLQGVVVVLEPPRAFINLGSQSGLTNAMTSGIILRDREVAGLRFSENVGRFTIVQRGPEASLIELIPSDGISVEVGDIVRITPANANITEVTLGPTSLNTLQADTLADPQNFAQGTGASAVIVPPIEAAPAMPSNGMPGPLQTSGNRCDDPGATVTIPDSLLLVAVQSQLGLDTPPTCADMLGLYDLNIDLESLPPAWTVNDAKIRDLSGLETAHNLEYLSLPQHQIRDLSPLAELQHLRELLLFDNQIDDLSPLAGLTGLEALVIDDNRVRDLAPLAGQARLYKLWLNGNPVHDLSPLANLTALEELRLESTDVVDLGPIGGLHNLDVLILSDTAVRDLAPLRGLPALSVLRLDYTAVRDLAPLASLGSLEQLQVEALDLTNSDLGVLASLPNLIVLSLGGNDISDLSPLADLAALEILYMWNNRVTDVSPLAGLERLEVVYLGGNRIRDAAPLARLPLRELWLEGNPLGDLAAFVGNDYPDLVVLSLPASLRGSDAALTAWLELLRSRGVEVYFD